MPSLRAPSVVQLSGPFRTFLNSTSATLNSRPLRPALCVRSYGYVNQPKDIPPPLSPSAKRKKRDQSVPTVGHYPQNKRHDDRSYIPFNSISITERTTTPKIIFFASEIRLWKLVRAAVIVIWEKSACQMCLTLEGFFFQMPAF